MDNRSTVSCPEIAVAYSRFTPGVESWIRKRLHMKLTEDQRRSTIMNILQFVAQRWLHLYAVESEIQSWIQGNIAAWVQTNDSKSIHWKLQKQEQSFRTCLKQHDIMPTSRPEHKLIKEKKARGLLKRKTGLTICEMYVVFTLATQHATAVRSTIQKLHYIHKTWIFVLTTMPCHFWCSITTVECLNTIRIMEILIEPMPPLIYYTFPLPTIETHLSHVVSQELCRISVSNKHFCTLHDISPLNMSKSLKLYA